MQLLRVLLIEDDDAYSALIEAQLNGFPVRLERAPTLSGARAAVRGGAFDAILLDLGLPDSQGLASVEQLQSFADDTPVIVLTSAADDQLPGMALQLGADDYLLKHEVDGSIILRAVRYSLERSAFRRRIRDSEARFRAMVENGYEAITLISHDGRIIFDSRSIVRVTGYTPEERAGAGIGSSIHPDDLPLVRERFAYCLAHPDEVLHVSYRFRHKDGSWRFGEGTGVNQLANPAVQAVVVNHRDVTDRVTMEHALRQAQKMEAIGRLAGGVAHDFNNVLTAIFGYTDLLVDQFPPEDPRRTDVIEIRNAAERAATLTRQLLAFSRKQIVQPVVLDLNATVKSVEKLLGRLVSDDVQVQFDLAPDLGTIRADAGSMEQVLMNLAANARDAMPEGGRLRLTTRNVDVATEVEDRPGLRPGAYVLLTVNDTGVGMSSAVREHVFEPFFTTKEQGKGTGLGLATVYGAVKQGGGYVYVESEEGQGTTFYVYLPRLAATASP